MHRSRHGLVMIRGLFNVWILDYNMSEKNYINDLDVKTKKTYRVDQAHWLAVSMMKFFDEGRTKHTSKLNNNTN